jgi:Ca2+/Na+ antiporter
MLCTIWNCAHSLCRAVSFVLYRQGSCGQFILDSQLCCVASCLLCLHVALILKLFCPSLSYVTEQVAEHTNGTIGALLNATFGNAPELLIATAALRAGFYRVVQLTMLGSMLTNLLFVFGLSCLVGGCRWQVQELRITSGNVSVGMLLLSTTASLLPASLVLTGQLRVTKKVEEGVPSQEELTFCRVNALVMIVMYVCYLVFQLGTHKEEFDEEENIVESAEGHQLHLSPHFTSRHGRQKKARRNDFCLRIIKGFRYDAVPKRPDTPTEDRIGDLELPRFRMQKTHGSDRKLQFASDHGHVGGEKLPDAIGEPSSSDSSTGEENTLLSHDDFSATQVHLAMASSDPYDNGYANDPHSSAASAGEMLIGSDDVIPPPGTEARSSRRRAIAKARSNRRKKLNRKQGTNIRPQEQHSMAGRSSDRTLSVVVPAVAESSSHSECSSGMASYFSISNVRYSALCFFHSCLVVQLKH